MHKLPALSLSALILSGCATALTMENAQSGKMVTEHDHIRHIAQIKNDRVPSLVLLGDQYSYRIMNDHDKGSLNTLTALAATLDPQHIRAKPVQIELSSYGGGFARDRVSFVFDYTKDTPLSASEAAILNKYCQKTGATHSNCTLTFSAQVHAKQAPTDGMTALKGNYPVEIKSFKTSKGPGAALVPLAVALDAVTLPVQALTLMGCEKDCFK